jgi:SAM-dependent methyltransferase
MFIHMRNLVENNIELNENRVWTLGDQKEFDYSDGRRAERYLEKVLSKAKDLSSNSYELEELIKDWPSEYHLSRKRAQLLSCFDFDRSKKVLEVGCGCGAITRFLGETFHDVLAVEGSIARANLARMRTKDLQNVAIICAPFQELKFTERFDIIFCIGVYEYSNIFVDAPDPYNAVLQYFDNILTSDGILVIGIENQFGLKYFASSKEDHTGVWFDGLEGYPRFCNRARTFGYEELKKRLNEYFRNIEFYFPYPDYKVPSCILSESFMEKAKASELIGNLPSRDYFYNQKSLFDEKLVLIELDKNNKLTFFSNSFLVVAGKKDISSINFRYLGLLYSADRVREFQTVTQFVEHEDGSIWVEKKPYYGVHKVESGSLTLKSSKNRWIDGLSLQSQLMRRSKEYNISIDELVAPCKTWLKELESIAYREGDQFWLEGRYIDCIWRNSYIRNGQCIFIDLEWEWKEKISLNAIVIRSIYLFLYDLSSLSGLTAALKLSSTKRLIKDIAKAIGTKITKRDFKAFVELHSEFIQMVYGKNRLMTISLRLKLLNRPLFMFLCYLNRKEKRITQLLSRVEDYLINKIA